MNKSKVARFSWPTVYNCSNNICNAKTLENKKLYIQTKIHKLSFCWTYAILLDPHLWLSISDTWLTILKAG